MLWPSNACSTLIASFALVSKYGIWPFDWQKVIALFDDICRSVNNFWLQTLTEWTNHSLAVLDINLIAKHNLWYHQRKAFSLDDLKHLRMGNYQDLWEMPESRTHLANYQGYRNSLSCWHHTLTHSSRRLDRMPHQAIEISLVQQYPRAILISVITHFVPKYMFLTCIVTNRSSTSTSFVRKSAPIVAL